GRRWTSAWSRLVRGPSWPETLPDQGHHLHHRLREHRPEEVGPRRLVRRRSARMNRAFRSRTSSSARLTSTATSRLRCWMTVGRCAAPRISEESLAFASATRTRRSFLWGARALAFVMTISMYDMVMTRNSAAGSVVDQ